MRPGAVREGDKVVWYVFTGIRFVSACSADECEYYYWNCVRNNPEEEPYCVDPNGVVYQPMVNGEQ